MVSRRNSRVCEDFHRPDLTAIGRMLYAVSKSQCVQDIHSRRSRRLQRRLAISPSDLGDLRYARNFALTKSMKHQVVRSLEVSALASPLPRPPQAASGAWKQPRPPLGCRASRLSALSSASRPHFAGPRASREDNQPPATYGRALRSGSSRPVSPWVAREKTPAGLRSIGTMWECRPTALVAAQVVRAAYSREKNALT